MIAMPKRIGGKSDEDGPGLTVISIKPKMPKRIGGPTEEEEAEDYGESMDGAAVKQKAVKELLLAIEDNDTGRASKALEAFVRACDAEPHDEGEHDDEGGE